MRTLSEVSSEIDSWRAPKKQKAMAKNPLALATGGNPFSVLGGDRQTREAAEQYKHYKGRVFSAIRVLAQRVASQRVFVARAMEEPGNSLQSQINAGIISKDTLPNVAKFTSPEQLDVANSHPVLEAIECPNEIMVRSGLFEVTVANLCVTGRAFWLLTEEDGKPKINPLPSTWMKPRHDKGPFAEWEVKPPGTMGDPKIVPNEDVAHFYFPNPSDPFGCISPLQMQAQAIRADESISTAQDVAFRNGIHPATAIVVGDAAVEDDKKEVLLEPHQRKDLIDWIQQQYQGVQAYGLPIVLDALIKDVKDISRKPEEMAFLDSAQISEIAIFMGFGVSPISAGKVDDANRATSVVADFHLTQNATNPIIEMMSQVLTKWVGKRFAQQNEKLIVWIERSRPHDPEMEVRKWEVALGNDVRISDNEVRVNFLGLPPIKGGDVTRVDPNKIELEVDRINDVRPSVRSKSMRRMFLTEWEKQQSRAEKSLANDIAVFLNKQVDSVISKLHEVQTKGASESIARNLFTPRQWDKKLIEVAKPHLSASMELGVEMERAYVWSQKGKRFKALPDDLLSAIADHLLQIVGMEYWGDINDVTLALLGSAINRGLQNGLNLNDMTAEIRMVLGEAANQQRAVRIARTESTGAMNAGHWLQRNQLAKEGLVYGAEWQTIGDVDVRGNDPGDKFNHVSAHGQKVRIGQWFKVSGEKTPYPAWHGMSAGNRIHCRCVAVSLLDPNELLSA